MRSDDVGLVVAASVVVLVPMYLLVQLVRVYPEVFGPVALLLLLGSLLAVLVRMYQRAVRGEAELAESSADRAGRIVGRELVDEVHEPWEARR